LSKARAERLVRELELDLDRGICHACLSFVSFAMDDGTPAQITGEVTRMTPYLWDDGLSVQAFEAVQRACAAGVRDAEEALADLEDKGGRSATARAIVRRLAAELSERERRELRLLKLALDRPRPTRPELN
jgi:hypothetical protein